MIMSKSRSYKDLKRASGYRFIVSPKVNLLQQPLITIIAAATAALLDHW